MGTKTKTRNTKTTKIAINRCYGGFGLSDEAYEKLAEYGVPVRKYVKEERGKDGLCLPEPRNDGEIIFDRALSDDALDKQFVALKNRYWERWTRENRTHPLLIKVIEELGSVKASGMLAKLKIVEIPEGVEWEIDEYDGIESVAEKHRSWA